MRVPLSWLHEYCAPELDSFALAERLAMTGTEVERIETHGVSGLEHFVVGRVLDAHRHPGADRLSVCSVDVGIGEPTQIVCGAPNVATGQTVAVGRPGSVMPDGTRLKSAKLRGEVSHGMILAEDEVAIGLDHEGIMVLDDTLAPGTPLAGVLPIADEVLVLEVTPNRPDCLGVYGVAREVHAATGAPLADAPWAAPDLGSAGELAAATVHVRTDRCRRFTARAFEAVTVGPSPRWLKARLMAAGQRPISNVVDVTNYVMLLTGQPLHAFDLDRVVGATLTVRAAGDGEPVDTLDGQTRTLDAETTLIADGEGPTSIAGVMGGARSEVGAGTTRVLIEVATWDGPGVHRTSLALGLRSEASSRNEKGLQPEAAMAAQVLATRLMVEVCGATVLPGTIDLGPGDAPFTPDPDRTLRLREARVERLIGLRIPRERQAEILTALDFTTAEAPDGLAVTVPALRREDVTREADLIEEVARLGALEHLPATLPPRHGASGRLTARQRLRRAAADALAAQGLSEVLGWAFEGPERSQRLGIAERPAVRLRNPMSADQSRMRTTLAGSLLDVTARNRARNPDATRPLALFETAAVYLPRDGAWPPGTDEPFRVAAMLTGPVRSPSWREPAPPTADFFAAKGVLGGLLDGLGIAWAVRPFADGDGEPFLHPGRRAAIEVGGTAIGWLGEIHPRLAGEAGLSDAVAGFELALDALEAHLSVPVHRDLTSFPEVREDLAVVLPDTVSAADALAVVREAAGRLLVGAEVFDVYRDAERLGADRVSLALRLRFRAADRTLTDEEVSTRRGKIAAALSTRLEGRVRDG